MGDFGAVFAIVDLKTSFNAYAFHILFSNLPVLLQGALMTIEITALSVGFGLIIGLFMGLFRLSNNKPVSALAVAYIEFFRGTPLLVQIFLIYYAVLPAIFGNAVNAFTAAVIACSLNSGAYIAEIVRAGIQSIDRGQMEAAMSLGMNYRQAMSHIILPQAFKVVIPPLINEFIAMLKDTSLVSTISAEELTRKGQLIIAYTWQTFIMWTGVAIMYLIMTLVISRLGIWVERRLQTS
jgi:polar amino acid transport system permease protein